MPALRRFSLPLIAAFFALYVIWGSTYLVIRIGVEYWPPLLLAGVRFVIAGSLMYAWLRWRGAPAPTWAQWRAAGLVGILLLSFGNGAVSVAEHTGVASGVAALAVATVPLFTLLFGYFWGARNTRLEWAGVALGIIGIAMLNMGSNLQSSPLGAVLLIFAAASWAFGSVWSKYLPLPAGAMASAVEMLVGGMVLLIGSALSGEHLQAMPPLEGWLALAYLIARCGVCRRDHRHRRSVGDAGDHQRRAADQPAAVASTCTATRGRGESRSDGSAYELG
jgi:drug/metabolite transporter (DMT)-like permease